MTLKWMLGAALLLAPVAANAQALTIKRGEAVTVTIDDKGVHVVDRGDAVPTNFEIVYSAEVQRGDYAAATGSNVLPANPNGSGAFAPRPEPGKIVLRFVRTPNKDQSLLAIQNGYGRALVYRAVMHAGTKSEPTDVCLVIPGKVGTEHWPYPIEALDLSELRLVAWQPGDPIPCA